MTKKVLIGLSSLFFVLVLGSTLTIYFYMKVDFDEEGLRKRITQFEESLSKNPTSEENRLLKLQDLGKQLREYEETLPEFDRDFLQMWKDGFFDNGGPTALERDQFIKLMQPQGMIAEDFLRVLRSGAGGIPRDHFNLAQSEKKKEFRAIYLMDLFHFVMSYCDYLVLNGWQSNVSPHLTGLLEVSHDLTKLPTDLLSFMVGSEIKNGTLAWLFKAYQIYPEKEDFLNHLSAEIYATLSSFEAENNTFANAIKGELYVIYEMQDSFKLKPEIQDSLLNKKIFNVSLPKSFTKRYLVWNFRLLFRSRLGILDILRSQKSVQEKANAMQVNEKKEVAYASLFNLMQTPFGHPYLSSLESKAYHEAVPTVVALHQYFLEEGNYPQSIMELKEKGFLAKIPSDPYLPEKPLGYFSKAGGYVLYSVGEDFVDHGGVDKFYQDGPGEDLLLSRPLSKGSPYSTEEPQEDLQGQKIEDPLEKTEDNNSVAYQAPVPDEVVKIEIGKAKTEQALDHLDRIFTEFRMVPNLIEGKPLGLKVLFIKEGSILSEMGFRKGDVVLSINGIDANLGTVPTLFKELKDSQNSHILFVRGGKLFQSEISLRE